MWAWHRAYGVPSIVMATGVVIGPEMRREVFIFKWLWNALHGQPIMVEGGQQTRDLTYIDDVVRAWTLAIEAPENLVVGEKFYVGYGEEHTVEELARICRAIVRSDVPIEYADYRPERRGSGRRSLPRKPVGCWVIIRNSLRRGPSPTPPGGWQKRC